MINLLLLFAILSVQEGSVGFVSGDHVTVYYPSTADGSIARSYLSILEQMYASDSDMFKIGTSEKLRVRLCRDSYQFSDLTASDSIFSPLWKEGTLYVIIHAGLSDPTYRSALEAGVIHGILSRIHPNGAPLWLIYSAAVYESGAYKDCTAPPIANVQYFADLDEKIQSASTPSELTDLCFYLGNTGKFFDLTFGVGSLLNLVQEFQHETAFNVAVKKLFHVERAQLESDWREFLGREAEGK